MDALDLLDWKRRIFELYAEVRSASDPQAAWTRWREVRDELYGSHPQTPVAPGARASFDGVDYFPYDPGLRFLAGVEEAEPVSLGIAGSAGSTVRFTRFGVVRFALGELELYWLDGYGGGVFLPFGDATNGSETYGAGRYLLDAAKSADLGGDLDSGTLILDFNFAFQPSCAFDPKWACPLAPPSNRLDLPVRAGERLA